MNNFFLALGILVLFLVGTTLFIIFALLFCDIISWLLGFRDPPAPPKRKPRDEDSPFSLPVIDNNYKNRPGFNFEQMPGESARTLGPMTRDDPKGGQPFDGDRETISIEELRLLCKERPDDYCDHDRPV